VKENTGAGALEREDGSAGKDGKREKASFLSLPFPAFPARFFPNVQSRRDCRRPLRRREL